MAVGGLLLFSLLCLAEPEASTAWALQPLRHRPEVSATWALRPHHADAARKRAWAAPVRKVVRPCSGKLAKEPAPKLAKEPAPILGALYALAGYATMAAWAACVVSAWSRSPVANPALHWLTNVQPLTTLPLVSSVFTSLGRSAAKEGWWAMNRMTYRRLNLGVAAASLWLAAVAFFGPSTRTQLSLAVAAAHAATGLSCLLVWQCATKASAGNPLVRLARGLVGSLWALGPQTSETGTISKSGSASHLDDPECPAGRDGRNEYSIACALFLWFTVMPNLVDLPLATIPAVFGKQLAGAASAWTFLAAVAAYVLKDATQRGRIHSGTTFRYLRYGFIAASGAHLLMVALEICVVGGGMRHLRADIASVVMHAVVVLAALTPPPKVPKKKSEAAPAVVTIAPAVGGLKLGQKVTWNDKSGIVCYVGPTKFATGEWIGVELDAEEGVHNGTVLGISYFVCGERRGIFAKAAQLAHMT